MSVICEKPKGIPVLMQARNMLQCVAVWCCSVMLQCRLLARSLKAFPRQCNYWMCCSVLQCTAMCCSVLQCVAVNYLQGVVLQCTTCKESQGIPVSMQESNVLQCAAVCCSVLQCVAVCCSALQCVAVSIICEESKGILTSMQPLHPIRGNARRRHYALVLLRPHQLCNARDSDVSI